MQPLRGVVVAVTRAAADATHLTSALEKLGAVVECMPALRIVTYESAEFDAAIRDAGASPTRFLFVITSANGAGALLDACRRQDIPPSSLAPATTAVVGPATAEPLRSAGVEPTLISPVHTAHGLVEAIRQAGLDLRDRRIVYPRARDASETIRRGLGPSVEEYTVYSAEPEACHSTPTRLPAIVTFASGSAARYFAHVYPRELVDDIRAGVPVVCIGPSTADTAIQQGYKNVYTADVHTTAGLVEAVTRVAQTRG